MTHRPLPHTQLRVSPLCLGLGDLGTRLTGDGAVRLLEAFLASGGNFVDTAHCYGFWGPGGIGASEAELGRAMQTLGCRDDFIITTKGGHPAVEPDYPRPEAYLSPEVIASDVRESLQRLQTDTIDLYLLHRDDPRVSVGEIIEILNAHVASGELRYLGVSNWSVARLAAANAYAAAHGLQGFVVSQIHFSLADPTWPITEDPTMRTMDSETHAWHVETGFPVMGYCASAGGFFAGRDNGYATPGNLARRERTEAVAAELGATPTQIALAYLLAQPFATLPIVGTLTESHLLEAVEATHLGLSASQAAAFSPNRWGLGPKAPAG